MEREDPRCSVKRKHPPVSVVVSALRAVRAGANGPTAIARRAALKEEFLVGARDRPAGVPGKDVFRRALMALRPGAFRAGFVSGRESLRAAAAAASGGEQPVLAVDGQTNRRGPDRQNGPGAGHSVTVRAREFGLSPGPVAGAEESHAITAIPEALRLVDLKGAIITRDAIGARKAIAARISDGQGDDLPGLKGNRESLHQAVIDSLAEQLEGELEGAPEHVTVETGPGREEARTYLPLPAAAGRPGSGRWKALRTIAVVTAPGLRDGKETVEVRYSISSPARDGKRRARAVRGHWGLANGCQGVLDVTDREDESRIREAAPRENFAGLNRFTLSLLKQHPDRTSIARKRRRCGWNEDDLLQVITGSTI